MNIVKSSNITVITEVDDLLPIISRSKFSFIFCGGKQLAKSAEKLNNTRVNFPNVLVYYLDKYDENCP